MTFVAENCDSSSNSFCFMFFFIVFPVVIFSTCQLNRITLQVDSAASDVRLNKNTVSGCKVILIQFFAVISNLKSELENL